MNEKLSATDPKYEMDDIRVYISHAITSNTHLFIIEKDEHEIGVVGYNVVDEKGTVDIQIDHKESLFADISDSIVKVLMDHIKSTYNIHEVSSLFYDIE